MVASMMYSPSKTLQWTAKAIAEFDRYVFQIVIAIILCFMRDHCKTICSNNNQYATYE